MNRIIIKVGGSLGSDTSQLQKLGKALTSLSRSYLLFIVPGGGDYANLVRQDYHRLSLSEKIAHYMAILAMNQYGYLLHHLIKGSQLTESPLLSSEKTNQGAFVWLPYAHLLADDPFPYTWEVTSDSIAAYAAKFIQPDFLILLKDQDGVYPVNPKENRLSGQGLDILTKIPRKSLPNYQLVDPFFARQLPDNICCWIINGRHPERLMELLLTGTTTGTTII
jgi:aspartokinase-like uncharacterized kinase